MNERTHLDLFSGLGGFALAARANGVRTIQFCECDPRCQAFLAKAWPGVPVHGDVRSFSWTGTVWLLTAGVPCQPASRAGKQRGKEDDRWLWPDAIRVIAAVQPTWALLENPPGIGDVGLNGILSALEAQGYEVRVLSIPACAVNAPHRRERYWIVCHKLGVGQADSEEARHQGHRRRGLGDGEAGWQEQNGPATTCPESELGNAEAVLGIRRSRPIHKGQAKERRGGNPYAVGLWNSFVWLPCADGKVRRAPDDSISLVDGLHRSLLGALGNSIVWPVAAEIIKAMILSENENMQIQKPHA